MPIDFSTRLGPVELKNPILLSAGTAGYGLEFEAFFPLDALGGIITKTLTLEPRSGHPAPRLIETPSGMMNAVGLQNIGISNFIQTKWPLLQTKKVPTIVSVAGYGMDEFQALAALCEGKGFAAIEINLSCPNVHHGAGKRCFSQDAELTFQAVQKARSATTLPIFAKLTAEVSDLPEIAEAAQKAGATGVTLINTISGMVIDIETEKPFLFNKTGGLSGPAIRPIAVRCIAEVFQKLNLPILGIGGVLTGQDALELVLAGASAIAIGTANFWNPRAGILVRDELHALLTKKQRSLAEMIGKAVK